MKNNNIMLILGGIAIVGLGYWILKPKESEKKSDLASLPEIAGGTPRTNPNLTA
jgi:hypothetical protein